MQDSEDASRKILAREDASSDTPDIVQRVCSPLTTGTDHH